MRNSERPPRPPKRDYNAERQSAGRIGSGSTRIGGRLSSFGRMAGQAGSLVFKELTKPAPKGGASGNQNAEEEYGIITRAGGEITLEQALRKMADLPPSQRKLAEANLWLSSVPNLKRQALTSEKVALARKKLSELLGEKEAERGLKPLEGLFDTRSEVSGKEGGKRIRERGRNLHGWQRDIIADTIEGLDQKKAPINRRNKQVITHLNVAQTKAKLAKKYGEHAATKFARPFYPKSLEEKETAAATRGAKRETFVQKRGVGMGSTARTREAAREGSLKRSSSSPSEGRGALSRLKSFITK